MLNRGFTLNSFTATHNPITVTPLDVEIEGSVNFEQNWRFQPPDPSALFFDSRERAADSDKTPHDENQLDSRKRKKYLRLGMKKSEQRNLQNDEDGTFSPSNDAMIETARKNRYTITVAPSIVTSPRTPRDYTTVITVYYKPQTQIIVPQNDIYKEMVYVRDIPHIPNFTALVLKQNMEVFANLRAEVNESLLKTKLDYLAQRYKDKFIQFVNETQKQKILTRLGNQKVILNIIETSKRYMNRLLNYLIADIITKSALRTINSNYFETELRNQLDDVEQQQYIHACQIYHTCYTKQSYTDFLGDIFNSILSLGNSKLRRTMDCMTESLKNAKQGILTTKMGGKFAEIIELIQRTETYKIRPVLWMFRNIIKNKNQPLVIPEKTPMKVVNQTVAIIDILDMLDHEIQPTEENILQWTDIRTSVKQWANDEREDIQDIMQAFTGQFIENGIVKMSDGMMKNMYQKLKVIVP